MIKKYGIAHYKNGGATGEIVSWKRNVNGEDETWDGYAEALEANDLDGWRGYVREYPSDKLRWDVVGTFYYAGSDVEHILANRHHRMSVWVMARGKTSKLGEGANSPKGKYFAEYTAILSSTDSPARPNLQPMKTYTREQMLAIIAAKASRGEINTEYKDDCEIVIRSGIYKWHDGTYHDERELNHDRLHL